MNNLEDKIKNLQRQLSLEPSNPLLLREFAKLFLKHHKQSKSFIQTAIHCLEYAAQTNPSNENVLIDLANAYLEINDFTKAIDTASLLLTLNEYSHQGNALLGSIYLSLGKAIEAKSYLETANRLSNYQNINYLRNYLATEQLSKEELDETLKIILDLLPNMQINSPQYGELNYLAAQIFNKNTDYKQAVIHWTKGAEALHESLDSKIKLIFEYLEAALNSFSQEDMEHLKEISLSNQYNAGADRTSSLIFIVGLPRTGSTLVEQMLLTRIGARTVGESNYFAEALVNELNQDLKEILPNLKKLSTENLINIRRKYFDYTQCSSKIIIDKTLSNFLYLPIIKACFPEAKIIVTERDWEETRFSCFTQYFTEEQVAFSYSFSDLNRYNQIYEMILNNFEDKIEFLRSQYEDLICEPELSTGKIFQFACLDWDTDVLNFHKNSSAVLTASMTQVKKPLYKSSLKKWELYKALFEAEINHSLP
jgi:lipopolysaccharide biosynthesis regulator YciM